MDKLNDRQKICLEFVASLPIQMDRYNQKQGMYTECGCCVGAYAAHHFGVAFSYDKWLEAGGTLAAGDFEHGYQTLTEKLGYALVERLEKDLTDLGAPIHPFREQAWEVHPRKVFLRLAYEKLGD